MSVSVFLNKETAEFLTLETGGGHENTDFYFRRFFLTLTQT